MKFCATLIAILSLAWSQGSLGASMDMSPTVPALPFLGFPFNYVGLKPDKR